MHFWTIAAGISLLVWLYLCFFHGAFWRIDLRMPAGVSGRKVVAVVPARNEADVIARSIASLLRQGIHVVLVDDNSADGTAEVIKHDNLTVIRGAPLPAGWTGKLWAVSQGAQEALKQQPDYILFTDADIEHAPNHVAEMVAKAEADRLDLTSHMVLLSTSNLAERALIPAFVYFFLQLYPPRWIADPKNKTAGAAGGCILLRPSALERIGGHAAIRGEIIDDCSLARAVKNSGGRIWMGLTQTTCSLRPYRSFGEIGGMISRAAFNQLKHSALLLIGTLIGLLLTYVAPIAALLFGHPIGAAAWMLMSFTYLPVVRLYKLPVWLAFALPVIALFYAGATFHSAIQYWRGKGGVWKGRVQDA